VALVYSWFAAAFRPFTWPENLAVAIPVLLVLVAWELTAYFSSPRHDHPTLSTVADDIMSSHPGRTVMFGLWLALGWLLFVRSPPEQGGRP
jgi:hypothetical protein